MKKIIIILLLFCTTLSAQTDVELKQLNVLLLKQEVLQKRITELEKIARHPEKYGKSKRQIIKEISSINKELEQTESYFRYISSGLQSDLSKGERKKFRKQDLWKEVQNILNPVVSTLSKISARPRKIEQLRTQLEENRKWQQQLQSGIKKLESYIVRVKKERVKKKLEQLQHDYQQQLETLQLTQQQLQLDLDKLVNSKESLLKIWSQTFFNFFKTKGINLFLSFLAFALIWFFLIRLKNVVLNLQFLNKQAHWAIRPLNVLYTSLIFLIALLFAIFVLYIRNDWFLVTIIIIFILGFLWSIKQWIPQFISKGKLLLNLGPIRENELIIWHGVPYKIEKLSYFSTLVNPHLSGGRLRISIDELAKRHSRKILSTEQWFPTQQGDWVELKDGLYGEIVEQTPEHVAIKSYRGTTSYYQIETFLSLAPCNYSAGFLLESEFAIALDEIEQIREGKKVLQQIIKQLDSGILEVDIEFAKIETGSGRLIVLTKCSGDLAEKRFKIEYKIYRTIIDFMLEQNIALAKQTYVIDLHNKE